MTRRRTKIRAWLRAPAYCKIGIHDWGDGPGAACSACGKHDWFWCHCQDCHNKRQQVWGDSRPAGHKGNQDGK